MSMDDMLNLRRTETENWLLTEFYCNSLLEESDKGPTSEQYTLAFWPFLNPYFSPLNPIYTPVFQKICSQGLRPLNERQMPVWMLRDGAVPLSWFFAQNEPDLLQGQILVHADLKDLVPETWAGKVASYRHRSKSTGDIEKLLVIGPISETVISLQELDEALEKLGESLGKKRIASMPVHLYCPIRGEGESYPARYMQKIYSAFKRVKVVDWYDIENTGSFKGFGFVELNAGWLFKDSFVQQHALSRGASLVHQPPPLSKRVRHFSLSSFHGVDVEPFTPKARITKAKADRLEKFFMHSARLMGDSGTAGPWPKWHEKWCRALFQNKKSS